VCSANAQSLESLKSFKQAALTVTVLVVEVLAVLEAVVEGLFLVTCQTTTPITATTTTIINTRMAVARPLSFLVNLGIELPP
jgi:hypothetical protein